MKIIQLNEVIIANARATGRAAAAAMSSDGGRWCMLLINNYMEIFECMHHK